MNKADIRDEQIDFNLKVCGWVLFIGQFTFDQLGQQFVFGLPS